jgi:aminopeptidase YwaD
MPEPHNHDLLRFAASLLSLILTVSVISPSVTGCVQTKNKVESVTKHPVRETVPAESSVVKTMHDMEPATAAQPPLQPQVMEFDTARAMSHVTYLANTIGPRVETTVGERQAAQYIEQQLAGYGYTPVEQPVPIEAAGGNSLNISADLPGGQKPGCEIIVGAHMDTRNGSGPSPGGNDNATGCAVVLELARVLSSNRRNVPTVRFVFFGGEEIAPGGGENDHHFGSRQYVADLTPVERSSIRGIISVDMVGFGPSFLVRNMREAPQTLVDLLLDYGKARGLSYLADTSSSGMSDHEPFERASIPSAWIEYRNDERIHGPGDTSAHVDSSKVGNTGQFLQGFFEEYLTPERLSLLP